MIMHDFRTQLSRMARPVLGQISPHAIVLGYHRVIDAEPDSWSMNVTPRHFEQHLEVVRRLTRPMALNDLVSTIAQRRRPPPRSVVMTMDDGYQDNLVYARPLLLRFEMPATVFVTTGIVDVQQQFWWDALEDLILCQTLPPRIALEIGKERLAWDLNNREPTAGREERQKILHDIWTRLLPISHSDRDRILARLRTMVHSESVSPRYPVLDADGVRHLEEPGLVDIGAHTVTHPSLAMLSPASQRAEMSHSKRMLERILGHPVNTLSYPFGTRRDVTRETAEIAEDLGFTGACTTRHGEVTRNSDVFRLPRYVVGDWDGPEFERRLRLWI